MPMPPASGRWLAHPGRWVWGGWVAPSTRGAQIRPTATQAPPTRWPANSTYAPSVIAIWPVLVQCGTRHLCRAHPRHLPWRRCADCPLANRAPSCVIQAVTCSRGLRSPSHPSRLCTRHARRPRPTPIPWRPALPGQPPPSRPRAHVRTWPTARFVTRACRSVANEHVLKNRVV